MSGRHKWRGRSLILLGRVDVWIHMHTTPGYQITPGQSLSTKDQEKQGGPHPAPQHMVSGTQLLLSQGHWHPSCLPPKVTAGPE